MIFLLLLCLAVAPSEQQKIIVDCNNGDDTTCTPGIPQPSCKTLDAALRVAEVVRNTSKTSNINFTTIHILNGTCYYINTTSNTTLTYNNVTITGNGSDVTIVECNKTGTGFGFINVNNINISGLTLSGCGQLRNSTTINISSHSVMLFRAALYFVNVTDVTIDDVVVSNSIGMGVAMYDVTGDVTVSNSIFRNNSVPSHEHTLYPGGGGFSVEFTYCKPGIVYCDNGTVNNGAMYSFVSCTFEGNNATTTEDVKYGNVAFGVTYPQFGRGGGLSVFFKGEAIGNKVTINNTKFNSNSAMWGAGYHSDFLDYSADNSLSIYNSAFMDNHCYYNKGIYGIGTGGGGVRIALHYYNKTASNNRIDIVQCNFTDNSASYGGGVSFSTVRERNASPCELNNTISFRQCQWIGNVARTGSGVDLNVHTFPQGIVAPVWFEDCKFIRNTNEYAVNQSIWLLGIGSLYSDAIPVEFYGNCVFIYNIGGALAATAATLTFHQDCNILFENNTGHHGGGIALLGNTYMLVQENTSLHFYGNHAKAKGGAIFSLAPSERDFVSNKKCFVNYVHFNISPCEWKTSFVFRNNSATSGYSIFVTTLLPCLWGDLPSQNNVVNLKDVLYWNGTFDYGNDNLTFEISTEPLNIEKTNMDVVIPPGELFDLNIVATDDKMDNTTAVFLVETDNTNNFVSVDPTSNYTSSGAVQLRGLPSTNFDLKLLTVGVRPLLITFHAKLDDCPPGYYIDGDGDKAVCNCSAYSDKRYYGIPKCDDKENKLVASLQPHIWAGYDGKVLVTGDCPANYCFENDYKLIPLPSSSSNDSLDALLCEPKRRTGKVCGECMENHYVYVNSPTYDCGSCNDTLSKYGTLFLILLKAVPMTIFLCIIMFFNISLVDGPLNAFILFSQILSAAHLYAGGAIKLPGSGKGLAEVLIKSYQFLYGIWNLNYFETLTRPFCTFKYRSALPVLALEYASASYPLVLFILFFSILPWLFSKLTAIPIYRMQNCVLSLQRRCIRFRAGWSVKNSIIHGLITFLVLAHVKFTSVTWHILTYTILYGPGGEQSNVTIIVSWVDGTKHYFGDVHGKYAAVALVVLICFVFLVPLFLLAYPYLQKLLTKLKLDEKWVVQKFLLRPLGHAVPFFDVIQGCFKDEYRFFAAFYFAYRVIAWAIFCFSTTVQVQYLWQIIFYTAILFLHGLCQPYRKRWHNMVDTFIFSLLILINTISFYRYSGFLSDLSTSSKSFWFQLFLIYCPLIYFAVYCLLCCRPMVCTLIRRLSGRNRYQVFEPRNENSAEFPARLHEGSSHGGSDDENKDVELKISGNWSHETPVFHNAATATAATECPSTIQDYGSTNSTI